MIFIHWDFVNGTELSYIEGKARFRDGFGFETNVLNFFCWDYLIDSIYPVEGEPFDIKHSKIQDVVVIKSNGDFISLRHLDQHTDKEIRWVHNVGKMLVANAFSWLPNFENNYDWDHTEPTIWERWKNNG